MVRNKGNSEEQDMIEINIKELKGCLTPNQLTLALILSWGESVRFHSSSEPLTERISICESHVILFRIINRIEKIEKKTLTITNFIWIIYEMQNYFQ